MKATSFVKYVFLKERLARTRSHDLLMSADDEFGQKIVINTVTVKYYC